MIAVAWTGSARVSSMNEVVTGPIVAIRDEDRWDSRRLVAAGMANLAVEGAK